MDGYLKCQGRLNGCPVTIVAHHKGYLVARLKERRGIWDLHEEITIEIDEFRQSGGAGRKDMFEDLPVGKRTKVNIFRYRTTSDLEDDK